MSDDVQRGATRLKASMERAIRRQLGRLPGAGIASPSDVLALLQWGDDATIPADAPIPDFMHPRETCPHCGGHPHANRMDEHIAIEHADLPPCTAALDNEHTSDTLHCVLRVPHRIGEYGEFHVSARGPIGRTIWNDSAKGAQPHREEVRP